MNTKKQPNICVLSGRYPITTFDSAVNHIAYCKQFGYAYIHCNWPTGAKNPYMNKMRYIQAYYEHFDFIFWIDDDAFFLDLEKPLDGFLPESDSFLSICSSPDYKAIHTYISSGQFMLRCNEVGRKFIDSIESTDLTMVKNWWKEELGFFSNGDQDAMVYHILTNPAFSNINRHHHTKFNSRVEEYIAQKPVFILHFTGTVKVKSENYKKVQRFSGLPACLLEKQYREQLNLKEPLSFYKRVIRKIKYIIDTNF